MGVLIIKIRKERAHIKKKCLELQRGQVLLRNNEQPKIDMQEKRRCIIPSTQKRVVRKTVK